MTTYTSISNALVAVGAKPFATTIQALRDNPLAIAEGDATAPVVAGTWVLLERQEPTTDVTDVTFTTDVSGYREIMVTAIGTGNAAVNMDVQIRTTAGSWRTMSRVGIAAGLSSFLFSTTVYNVDNSDGTNLRWATVNGIGGTTAVDRSDANAEITGGTTTIGRYYSSFTETINEVRVLGNIEGSTANNRGVFKLYGMVGPARDA